MMERLMFAFTASVFATIFLITVIVYGGHAARLAAITAAFLACGSQFCGPEPASYRASIYLAYFAFVAGLLSLLMFGMGR